MKNIDDLLKRGFGLVTINDLISVRLHDDIMKVKFEPLPGSQYKDGWELPIASRTQDGILEEISDYLYQLIITYHNHIAADLVNM